MQRPDPYSSEKYRIAVVGAGVAGIVAAFLLERKHEVTLYERNEELGGHTNTQVIPYGPDQGTGIDTGFIVFNDRTYPCFERFLDRLEILSEPSEMSFSYWNSRTQFGYAGTSLAGLFAQKRNLIHPRFYRMLMDIRRFATEALTALDQGDLTGKSLGDFLDQKGYSEFFRDNYLLPMGAAIWSTSPRRMMDYPAASLVGFFKNHGLLSLKDRPQWKTLSGRGHSYVRKFEQVFRGRIYKNSKIRSIREEGGCATLKHQDGSETEYDFVVLACHANQSLALLESPSDRQFELLGAWDYQENQAILHWDASAMPPLPRAWAAWNFLTGGEDREEGSVFVTYHMNRLQNLKTERQYFVTLNPELPIDPAKILYQTRYDHPLYTLKSLDTQAFLPTLNINSRILLCGSYFGHGFHEDAVKSGAAVAALFGLDL